MIVALPGLFSYLFVYSTDRSKVVVPVLVLLFVALWFIVDGYASLLNYTTAVRASESTTTSS